MASKTEIRKSAKVTFSLDPWTRDYIDSTFQKGGFKSKSEIVRAAIRTFWQVDRFDPERQKK